MFLTKDYIYQTEFARKRNVTINNFSGWFAKYPEYEDTGEIVRIGKSVFFRKGLPLLSPLQRRDSLTMEFTDISNKLPLRFLRYEYGFNETFCRERGYGCVIDLAGVQFFEFTENFKKEYDGVWYKPESGELPSLLEDMPDLKYFECAKNKFIVTY